MLLAMILGIINILLNVLWWIIIVQAVLSWLIAFNVINRHSDFVRQFYSALDRLTEPLYRPFRSILPDFGGIDLAPFCVLLLIMIVQRVVMPGLLQIAAGAPLV